MFCFVCKTETPEVVKKLIILEHIKEFEVEVV